MYTDKKRIGLFCLNPNYQWIANAWANVLNINGYNAHLADRTRYSTCDSDDITFLFLFSRRVSSSNPYNDNFKKIYKRSKCVVLCQFEPIHLLDNALQCFIEESQYSDVVLELFPERFEFTKAQIPNKKVLYMPFAYHESMVLNHQDHKGGNGVMLLETTHWPNRVKYHGELSKSEIRTFGPRTYNVNVIADNVNQSDICLMCHSLEGNTLATVRIIGHFMANKGFVMSQRSDYPYFIDGKHLVYFDSPEDMVDKIKYYLAHPEECRIIAENAFEYVSKHLRLDYFLPRLIKML